jgi:hypothetical protein
MKINISVEKENIHVIQTLLNLNNMFEIEINTILYSINTFFQIRSFIMSDGVYPLFLILTYIFFIKKIYYSNTSSITSNM